MSHYHVSIIADSVSPADQRLVTMALRYPRWVHSEFMAHRLFSRNAASSRAIPTHKLVHQVRTDPVVPIHWGKNQPGMQADFALDDHTVQMIDKSWRALAQDVAKVAEEWAALGLHKQTVNRILEPFLCIDVVVTATDWDNFYSQRCHPAAQPEIRRLAEMMRSQMELSQPTPITSDQWHLPFVTDEDRQEVSHDIDLLRSISVARCARVSYSNHMGLRSVSDDLKLACKLHDGGHYSPFEHVAQPRPGRWANFAGWQSLRNILDM